jgi:DNA modification methylase
VTPEVRLLNGDATEMLKLLPDNSVNCCITSPPYYGLRDYQCEGQIGLECSVAEYVARLIAVFREVWRVLVPDGVCFLNLGDSYSRGKCGRDDQTEASLAGRAARFGAGQGKPRPPGTARAAAAVLGAKNLLGVPWRAAFALQDAGWILRAEIILSKRAPMPESVVDRVTRSHEYLFHFVKRPRYFWDSEAIKEKAMTPAGTRGAKGSMERFTTPGVNSRPPEYALYDGWRNCRSVWETMPCPNAELHYAIMPRDIVARCILAGTSAHGHCPRCGAGWRRETSKGPAVKGPNGPGTAKKIRECQGQHGATSVLNTGVYHPKETVGWQPGCKHGDLPVVPAVVLDPFAGSGTTLLAALGHGRHAVGIDLNREYIEMIRRRLGLFAPAEETP